MAAREVISEAAVVVQSRESNYRVPLHRIAEWREGGPTVYRYWSSPYWPSYFKLTTQAYRLIPNVVLRTRPCEHVCLALALRTCTIHNQQHHLSARNPKLKLTPDAIMRVICLSRLPSLCAGSATCGQCTACTSGGGTKVAQSSQC